MPELEPHPDQEINEFEQALLRSVKQMKAGIVGRVTTPVMIARKKSGLSQAEFAKLIGISVRTLQAWEQGKRTPSGAAQTLIRVANAHPEILRSLYAAQ